MRKILAASLLFSTFVFNASGVNYNYIKNHIGNYQWVSKESGEIKSIDTILHEHGVGNYKNLPLTQSEFSKYYDDFYKSSSNQLEYLSDFWEPAVKSSIELEFSCLNKHDYENWLSKAKTFYSFVTNSNGMYFYSEVTDRYVKSWKEAFSRAQKSQEMISYGIYESFYSFIN